MTFDPQDQMNDDAIDGAAAAWLVEREDGFSSGQAEAFARWLTADPRHQAAFTRAEAADRLLRNLPRLREVPALSARLDAMAETRRARVIRGPWWQVVTLAAAAAVVIGAAVWWLPQRGNFRQSYSAARGVEKVQLPDDSVIELGASSIVLVNYSRLARDIELTRGEARFSVAKDAARPFIVAAGDVSVRAVGTVFDVTRRADDVEVRVAEGIVEITRATGIGSAREVVSLLGAGHTFTVHGSAALAVKPAAATAVPVAAPVTVSLLQFSNARLADVIAAFNARNSIQLVLGDDELAERSVEGTFDPTQVQALVRILEETQEISAEQTNSTIVLRKRN